MASYCGGNSRLVPDQTPKATEAPRGVGRSRPTLSPKQPAAASLNAVNVIEVRPSAPPLRARHSAPPPDRRKCLVIGTGDQLANGQAAADPAVVSISASPSMTSQPWEVA